MHDYCQFDNYFMNDILMEVLQKEFGNDVAMLFWSFIHLHDFKSRRLK